MHPLTIATARSSKRFLWTPVNFFSEVPGWYVNVLFYRASDSQSYEVDAQYRSRKGRFLHSLQEEWLFSLVEKER